MRMVASSRPVLIIAWEWHIGLALLCGCLGALEYPTTNSCGPINESLPHPLKTQAQTDSLSESETNSAIHTLRGGGHNHTPCTQYLIVYIVILCTCSLQNTVIYPGRYNGSYIVVITEKWHDLDVVKIGNLLGIFLCNTIILHHVHNIPIVPTVSSGTCTCICTFVTLYHWLQCSQDNILGVDCSQQKLRSEMPELGVCRNMDSQHRKYSSPNNGHTAHQFYTILFTYFCEIWDTTEFGPGWDSNTQPADLWANQ